MTTTFLILFIISNVSTAFFAVLISAFFISKTSRKCQRELETLLDKLRGR